MSDQFIVTSKMWCVSLCNESGLAGYSNNIKKGMPQVINNYNIDSDLCQLRIVNDQNFMFSPVNYVL